MKIQSRLFPPAWLGVAVLLLPLGLPAQTALPVTDSTSDAGQPPKATVIVRCLWPGPAATTDDSSASSNCTCVNTGTGSSCSCSNGAANTPASNPTPVFTVDTSSNTPAALVKTLKTATSCADAKAQVESAAGNAGSACTPLSSGSVNALLYSCSIPGNPL